MDASGSLRECVTFGQPSMIATQSLYYKLQTHTRRVDNIMKRKLAILLVVLLLLGTLAPMAGANTPVVITPPPGLLVHPTNGVFMAQGESGALTANVPVVWMSSAPTVVHVGQTTGVISGVGIGQATISALSVDGTSTATIQVNVTGPAGFVQLQFWWGHGSETITTPAATYQDAMNQIQQSPAFRPQFNHSLDGWFRSLPESIAIGQGRVGEILPADPITATSYRFLHARWVPGHSIGTVRTVFPDPYFQHVILAALTQTYGLVGITLDTPITASDLQFIRMPLDFSYGNGSAVSDLRGAHLLSGVTGFHNLTGQERTLDPVGPSTRIVHDIQVRNGVGGFPAVFPSHNGRVENNRIIWDDLASNVRYVHYDFNQTISLGGRSTQFAGRVILPIREGYPPSDGQSPLPFTDVPQTAAFYSAVRHVFESGIMNGTSNTTFEPNLSLDRAMLATILHRHADEPSVTFRSVFSDVTAGQWYSSGIVWASDNNIVNGVGGGRFAPTQQLAREELAVMMHRYAQSLGHNMTVPTSVTAPQGTSSWAIEAMRWATHHNLLTGTGTPTSFATRAQTAQFIYRFDNLFDN